jgi:hypothetical protein
MTRAEAIELARQCAKPHEYVANPSEWIIEAILIAANSRDEQAYTAQVRCRRCGETADVAISVAVHHVEPSSEVYIPALRVDRLQIGKPGKPQP